MKNKTVNIILTLIIAIEIILAFSLIKAYALMTFDVDEQYPISKSKIYFKWSKVPGANKYLFKEHETGKHIATTKKTNIALSRSMHYRIFAYKNDTLVAESKYYYAPTKPIKRKLPLDKYLKKNINKKVIDLDGYNWYKDITPGLKPYERLCNLMPASQINNGKNFNIYVYKHPYKKNTQWIKEIRRKGISKARKREAKTYRILKKHKYKGSKITKLKKIQEYMIKNLKYSNKGKHVTTAYSIVTGKANCTGYSRIFKYLCDINNIKCRICIGSDKKRSKYKDGNILHMWNIVKIGKRWYRVDTCWDDSYYEGGYSQYKYFLVSDKKHIPKEISTHMKPFYCKIKCRKSYHINRTRKTI